MRFIAIICAVCLLSACATTTGITPIGDGTYMLGTQTMGWSGSQIKADLFKEAAAFCAKNGKTFKPISDQGKDASFTEYASAEIKFACK